MLLADELRSMVAEDGLDVGLDEMLEQNQNPNDGLLYEIRLPEGDVPGLNIGWSNNGVTKINPLSWLNQGYAGVRFIGEGVGKTHVRDGSWDSYTVAIGNFPGIVEFRDLTIHGGGPDKGKAVGGKSHIRERDGHIESPVDPTSAWRFIDCEILAADPEHDLHRSTWGIFSYNKDLYLRNVRIDGKWNFEHNIYAHGTAGKGIRLHHVEMVSSGAEGLKLRSDAGETLWAGPRVKVHVTESRFADWYQPHSWRGGAAIVIQGGAAHVDVSNATFHPGPDHDKAQGYTRSYCIAVSAEGLSYDILTGRVSQGFGNGYVRIKNCLMEASEAGPSWGRTIMRVGDNVAGGGRQIPAMGVLVEQCGIFGENMTMQFDQRIPHRHVRNCNTENIIKYAREQYGMAALHEAKISSGVYHDASKGLAISPEVKVRPAI